MIGNLLVAFAKKALARTSRKKGSSGRTVLAAEIPKDNEEWGLPKSYHDIMTQNFCWVSDTRTSMLNASLTIVVGQE